MITRCLQRRRLADERGFTLVELLLAMSLGIIILGSASMITIGAARHNAKIGDRVDATQRGRVALDRIVQALRSQVCVTTAAYPLAAADARTVTFFSDISDGTKPVTRHTTTYDPTARRITDVTVPAGAGDTFTGAGTTDVLATAVDAPASGLIFRYYAYPTTAVAGQALQPDVELPSPVTGTDLGRISRIDISFLTTGTSRGNQNIRADMTDQVFVRLARPNDATSPNPVYNPTCT